MILTYPQAAQRIGCSVRSVQRLVKDGQLPRTYTGRRLPNGHKERGIPAAAAEAFAARGGVHGGGAAFAWGSASPRPSSTRAGGPPITHPPAPPQAGANQSQTRRPTLPSGAASSAPTNDARAREGAPDIVAVGAPLAAPPVAQQQLFDPGLPAPARRPDHLPEHIPITRDGLPDLPAMRMMGLDGQVLEYERRFRAVSRLRRLLAESDQGQVMDTRARVAGEFKCAPRTLRTWEAAVEQYGWAGLVPAYGKTRGRSIKLPRALQKQLLDAYTWAAKPSVGQLYERIVVPYYANDGKQLPHPSTIRAFLRREVPPAVKVLSREGVRAYQETVEFKVMRDLETAGTNGWWVSDHRLADTMVLVPDGQGAGWPSKVKNAECPCGSGETRSRCCSVRRLWWTVTCDVASGAWIAWRFSLVPNAATVCHMLRDGILAWGLPDHWLRDNGKEFNAARLDAGARAPAQMPPDVETSPLWEQLGVEVHNALPYSSWSKLIESLFGAFARRVENLLHHGWCGRSPKHKPEKLKKELLTGELLTADEYVTAVSAAAIEWNEHHLVGQRRQPPVQYYADYVPRRPDPQSLTFLIQARRTVKIRTSGLVLDGHQYVSDALAPYSGCRVDVLWDPGAPEWAYVYPGDGRCVAVQETPRAAYGEWGEPNRCIASARRAQRRFIAEWAGQVKGSCPPELMDPFGAQRMVRDRLIQLPGVRVQDVGAPLAAPAGAAAQVQEQARIEASAQEEEPDETVYDRIEEDFKRRFAQ